MAVRDLVSFLKYGEADSDGRANPVTGAGPMEKAYAFGRSQTGRCIRDAIWRGFNADAAGARCSTACWPTSRAAGACG